MKFIPTELRPYFKMSLGFHLGIFVVFGMKVFFFPDLSSLDDAATIKVDLVALPDKDDNKAVPKPLEVEKPDEPEKEEQAAVEQKPEPKKEEPKPEVAKVEKKKDAPKPKAPETAPDSNAEADAFAKLKEMQALKNITTTKDPSEANTAGPIKGNRLAPGDSLVGLNKIQYNNYKKVLQDSVKSKWDLPPWLQDGDLSAEALIKIDDTGLVTEKELIKPSGNSIYDKYVMETINKSSPFPPPPDKFVDVVAIKGVVLSFN